MCANFFLQIHICDLKKKKKHSQALHDRFQACNCEKKIYPSYDVEMCILQRLSSSARSSAAHLGMGWQQIGKELDIAPNPLCSGDSQCSSLEVKSHCTVGASQEAQLRSTCPVCLLVWCYLTAHPVTETWVLGTKHKKVKESREESQMGRAWEERALVAT